MAAHARLKNEFTEDEKYHNLMAWVIWGRSESNEKADLHCRMIKGYI